MSLQKMKFITLIAPKDNMDDILKESLADFEFHAENALETINDAGKLRAFNEQNPYADPIRKLEDAMLAMNIDRNEQVDAKIDSLLNLDEVSELCDSKLAYMKDYETKANEIKAKISETEKNILQLKPLEGTDLQIDEIVNMEFVKRRFGKMPVECFEKYKLYLSDRKNIIFIEALQENGYVWGFYFVPRPNVHEADRLFDTLHFEVMELPSNVTGTAKEAIATLTAEIESLKAELSALENETKEEILKYKDVIIKYYNYLLEKNEIFKLRNVCAQTDVDFYLAGWLPAIDADRFVAQFEDKPYISCTVENPEALKKKGVLAPSKVKNSAIVKPFAFFLDMYGKPTYGEIDPTPFMALTYFILFGIMFGDVGQGAIIFLGGLYFGFKKRMALGKILAYCGISSMIFGYVYGSVFGIEETIIPGFFHPMSRINMTIGLSIVIGIVMIVVVMLLNIINGFKQGDKGKVLFSTSGVCGLIFFICLVIKLGVRDLFLTEIFPEPFAIESAGWVTPLMLIALLLIFLREPLSELVNGEEHWMPKNIGSFIVDNIFELFEVVLSYITNTISYMRVGAFALNHVGMMMVVFILAGGHEDPNWIVVAIGNLFVMALEGLIVGIQVLRLEFYEMFSRFYDGGGKEFTPVLSKK